MHISNFNDCNKITSLPIVAAHRYATVPVCNDDDQYDNHQYDNQHLLFIVDYMTCLNIDDI